MSYRRKCLLGLHVLQEDMLNKWTCLTGIYFMGGHVLWMNMRTEGHFTGGHILVKLQEEIPCMMTCSNGEHILQDLNIC